MRGWSQAVVGHDADHDLLPAHAGMVPSWIPAEFAQAVPELARSERLKGGLSLDLIARATGRRVVKRVDEETARIATAKDLALLELEADTVAAILVLTASFFDADGELLEYGVDLGRFVRII
ncbi:UTRA domain-containing protein [Streptomyces sp. NPDC000229]|uniref:UTRA domain-containing protein n=1 Tax=Streptomyces sp. NPDC000229 TaxID=3154247 RepID=UPI0033255763